MCNDNFPREINERKNNILFSLKREYVSNLVFGFSYKELKKEQITFSLRFLKQVCIKFIIYKTRN